MSSEKHFLDEQGMTDLARKSIEVLRHEGASPTELRRLEALLKEGRGFHPVEFAANDSR